LLEVEDLLDPLAVLVERGVDSSALLKRLIDSLQVVGEE
jgi:hypothetical protein